MTTYTKYRYSLKRRGSVYVVVLGIAMILTILGLAAISVGRINTRIAVDAQDWSEAQLLAYSAVAHALTQIDNTSNWRTSLDGTTVSKTFGRGSFEWSLSDQTDGDLDDDETDPVTILARGTVNNAAYNLSMTAEIDGGALDILATTLSSSGDIILGVSAKLTLTDGPLSGNQSITNSGQIFGDVEADTVSGGGPYNGGVIEPAPPKAMPDPNIFSLYVAKATPITYTATMEEIVISPATTPDGVTNADGVYYIDTGGGDLTIRNIRLLGTLVIQCGGGKVTIDDANLMQTNRPDYPVLLIDGDLDTTLSEGVLGEKITKVNYNPPGTKYNGQQDMDELDNYPNQIAGLVHVTGDVLLTKFTDIIGTVICEGGTTITGNKVNITHDPNIYLNPPEGYAEQIGDPVVDTWKRVIE